MRHPLRYFCCSRAADHRFPTPRAGHGHPVDSLHRRDWQACKHLRPLRDAHTDCVHQDNPLHIALFPPHLGSELEFSFMLNSCLDIFDIRQHNKAIDQDLGLLQAVDERLAMYGWLTTTGIKFVIVVDMAGRPAPQGGDLGRLPPVVGLRDSDLKSVSWKS